MRSKNKLNDFQTAHTRGSVLAFRIPTTRISVWDGIPGGKGADNWMVSGSYSKSLSATWSWAVNKAWKRKHETERDAENYNKINYLQSSAQFWGWNIGNVTCRTFKLNGNDFYIKVKVNNSYKLHHSEGGQLLYQSERSKQVLGLNF